MTLRFVYQISSNLNKAELLGNVSYRGRLPRMRSLSDIKSGKFESYMVDNAMTKQRRCRSFSQPYRQPLKHYHGRMYSVKHVDRTVIEQEELAEEFMEEPGIIAEAFKPKRSRSTYQLQPRHLTPYCDHGVRTEGVMLTDKEEVTIKTEEKVMDEIRHKADDTYRTAVKRFVNKIEPPCERFVVDNSKSLAEKDRFDVFQKYRAAYYSKMSGHLQPRKIKPFGTIIDIIEPTYDKKVAITFPERFDAMEMDNRYAKVDTKLEANKKVVGDQRRKYCTRSDQTKAIDDLINENRLLNGDVNKFASAKGNVNIALNFVSSFQKQNENNSDAPEKSNESVRLEKQKFKFDGEVTMNLPEIEEKVIKIKIGPKLNLLQSTAAPEELHMQDAIALEKDERLGVPWPSYSESIKHGVPTDKKELITYPFNTNTGETEIIEAKADTVDQKRNYSTQVSTSSNNYNTTFSYHEDSKNRTTNVLKEILDEIVVFNAEEKEFRNWYKTKSFPDLLPYLRRKYSTKSKHGVLGPEGTVMPKLCRLPVVKIKEPEKICPAPPCLIVERSDENLKIKPKKLPVLKPSNCPCIELEMPNKGSLPRLNMRRVPEPTRICPPEEEECPSRADEGMKIKPKVLPDLVAKECPCVEAKYTDVPLLRLKRKPVVIIPKKVCEPDLCPPRADANLKPRKKRLPLMKNSDCPCVETTYGDAPPLKRLDRFCIPEPPKICSPPECPRPRADDNLKVKRRKLPVLKGECLCVEDHIPTINPPINRLKRMNILAPERCPPPVICDNIPRADGNMKIKCKTLPVLKPSACPCIEPEIPDKGMLPRLKMKKVLEPPRVCPPEEEECPSRADEGMKIKPKVLPDLVAKECPCVEAKYTDVPLLRLKRKPVVKAPKKVCETTEPCPPRADANLKPRKKRLPLMKNSDCPCVETTYGDAPPLKRLDRFCIPEPPKICSPPECPRPRADDNLKVKRRKLPVLKGECLCVDDHVPTINPPINRLKRITILAPERCPPPVICDNIPRADGNMKIKCKTLPVLKPSACPCIEPEIPDKGMLPRLKMKKVLEPPRVCPPEEEECPARADEGMKIQPKVLPDLVAKECPCVEAKYTDVPLLRLKRKPVVITPKKVCEPDLCPPRADANLKPRKKRLPLMKNSDCPCVETTYGDAPPLKRLDRFCIPEPPKICSPPECPRPRADDNLKVKRKCLPTMILSEKNNDVCTGKLEKKNGNNVNKSCKRKFSTYAKRSLSFLAQNFFFANRQLIEGNCRNYSCKKKKNRIYPVYPKLCRLKKREGYEEDDSIEARFKNCKPPPCEDMSRADDNYKCVKKILPRLKPSRCPCKPDIELKECNKLVRLKKRYKTSIDVDWEAKCRQDICTIMRADDGKKERKKCLPPLKPSACPCIEQVDYETPCMKRLPRFEKEDKDWVALCPNLVCIIPRADANLKLCKKILPRMKPGKCPCVEQPPQTDVCLKRLPKFVKDDVDWNTKRGCVVPPCPIPRADAEVESKFYSKRKLPCIMPQNTRKNFSTRLTDYNFFSKNLSKILQCRSISTTSVSYRNANTKSNGKQKKECKKLATKNCPTFAMPGCPPKSPRSCDDHKWIDPNCSKQKSPYPAFSECTEEEVDDRPAECLPDLKHLQPKNPLFQDFEPYPLPTPLVTHVDPSMEENCVYKKLGKKRCGLTRDCENYDDPILPLRARDILPDDEPVTGVGKDESKPGKDGACPLVVTATCDDDCPKKPTTCGQPACVTVPLCPAPCPCPEPKSLWERIMDFFRAKPNCPAPDEWKKQKMKDCAYKAAAAAGLEICEPKCPPPPACEPEPPACEPEPEPKPKSDCPKREVDECEEACVDLHKPHASKEKWKDGLLHKPGLECMCEEKPRKAKPCPRPPEPKSDCEEPEQTCDENCKHFKVDCPPRARKSCKRNEHVDPCTTVESPYPSFSDCTVAFPKISENECMVQERLARKKVKPPPPPAKKAKCGKRPKKCASKKAKKCFSTYSGQKRAYSSSSSNNRKPKNPLEIFDAIGSESLKEVDQNELVLKILSAVKEGVKLLERSGQLSKISPFFSIYNELEMLSDNDLKKLETKLLGSDSLRHLIERETLVNMLPTPSSCFRYNTDEEDKLMVMESFRQLWKNTPNYDYSILNYEESEKKKTEKMQDLLNQILKNAQLKAQRNDGDI